MKNIFYLSVFTLLIYTGCFENKSIVGTTNTVGNVDKIYGVGFNKKAAIGWEISSSEIHQFGIYRHSSPTFSYEQAVRLGTVSVSAQPGYIDTGLVNGNEYSYTIVPEQVKSDGSVVKGFEFKTISLKPTDLSSLVGNQIIYSQHIQPLFSKGCAIHGCHVGAGHHPLQKLSSGGTGLNLSSWSDALNGTDEIALIIPFRPLKSHIVQHLNRDTTIAPSAQPSMPPGFPFPAELRDVIIRWIEYGAKNDDGTVAYTAAPARGWAYVTNQGEDLTAVIDLDKFKIARYITTGVENTLAAPPQAPHNVVIDPQNQYYYVNLIGGSKLLKFRVSDNVKMGELSSGLNSPAQAAITKNGDTAYVSNFENAKTNITVVNTVSMTKLGDISSPAMLKPHGITITPDFQYVLVSNSLSDNVSIIRTSDNSIVAAVPMSGSVPGLPVNYAYQFEPYQSVVTPDSRTAYVTCRKSGEVRVIDLVQRKVVDSISVGTFPLIPAISPDGNYVFVANRNSNSVTAISTSSRTVAYTVANVGVEPHGIAVSKDGKYVYVSCENLGISEPPHHATSGSKKPSFLKVISIESRSVVASLELSNFGSGMAVTQ